jgi:hypothetical protein
MGHILRVVSNNNTDSFIKQHDLNKHANIFVVQYGAKFDSNIRADKSIPNKSIAFSYFHHPPTFGASCSYSFPWLKKSEVKLSEEFEVKHRHHKTSQGHTKTRLKILF